MNTSELVHTRHLDRNAEIYVRQSSPNQVLTNKESQRMQYALRERATSLGWQQQDVHVIDDDLGRSGASIEGREGYQNLVARIALGEVGILLAFDATRLARNCSHWYQLLDLCGLHDCLIADRDGVYDPSSINGRLLLGLKGQISELELQGSRGMAAEDDVTTEHKRDASARAAARKKPTDPGMGPQVAPGFANPWLEHRPVPPLPGEEPKFRLARASSPTPFEEVNSLLAERDFFEAGVELERPVTPPPYSVKEDSVSWWQRLFRRRR